MQHIERGCYQHGAVTTFAHSIRVACLAVWMADRLHLWDKVDLQSLVRAALLHDYFLYDWHDCLCSMVLRPVERLVFSPKER